MANSDTQKTDRIKPSTTKKSPPTTPVEPKPFDGFFRQSLGEKVGRWFGWRTFSDMGKDTAGILSLKRAREVRDSYVDLYESNMEGEGVTASLSFPDVLRSWGVNNSQELRLYKRHHKIRFVMGLLAFLYAMYIAICVMAYKGGAVSTSLNILLSISCGALGSLMMASAWWRLACIRKREFTPFLSGQFLKVAPWNLFLTLLCLDLLFWQGMAFANPVPQVEIPVTDISDKLVSMIFGSNWHNLAAGGGEGAGPLLIFELLKVFNSAMAVIISLVAFFATLTATVGAAKEGSFHQVYRSAWVPVRFGLAFAFVSPLPMAHGVNALQILLLSGIAISINLANGMWKAGIDFIADGGQTVQYVDSTSRVQIADAAFRSFEILATQAYLKNQRRCNVALGGQIVETPSSYKIVFNVPTQQDIYGVAYQPGLQPGDMGFLEISYVEGDAQSKELAKKRADAFLKSLSSLNLLAESFGNKKPLANVDLKNIVTTIEKNMRTIFDTWAKGEAQKSMSEARKEFTQAAEANGWAMAGATYWVLSKMAYKNLERSEWKIEFVDLDPTRLEHLISKDYYTDIRKHTEKYKRSLAVYTDPGVSMETAVKHVDQDSRGVFETIANFFDLPSVLAAQLSRKKMLESPDMLLSLSTASKAFVIVAESGLIGAAIMEGTLAAGREGADNWVANLLLVGPATKAGLAFTQTVLARMLSTLSTTCNMLFGVAWLYAYMIPAMPYLIWMVAIMGWLVLCVEAVIAAPVWLVGHAMPQGEGFAGASGRAGYMLYMSILIRPMLLTFCMFVCMIITSTAGFLIAETFGAFVEGANMPGLNGLVATFVIWGLLVAALTWKLFSLIVTMPDRIIRWAGQLLQHLGNEGSEMIGHVQQPVNSARQYGHVLASGAGGAIGGGIRAERERIHGNATATRETTTGGGSSNVAATATRQEHQQSLHAQGDVGAKESKGKY